MVPGWPWPRARRPRHLCRFMARRRWRRAGDLPCRECRSQHRRRVLGGPGEREGCSAGHGGLCLRCLPHVGGVSRVPQIAGTRATPDDGGTPSDQTPPLLCIPPRSWSCHITHSLLVGKGHPSGPPQKVCPPRREHPARAGSLRMSPQLGSHTLGIISSAGGAGQEHPKTPLGCGG